MSSSHRHRSATTTEPTSAASDLLPATASTSRREHSTHRDPQYHYNAAYYAHQSHDGGDGDGASDEYESQPHGTGTGTGSGRHKHKHTHSQSRGAAAATGGTRRGGKKASSRSPTPPPAPSRASLQPPKYSTVKAPRSGHHSTFSAAFAAASSAPSTPKASSFVRQPQVPPQRDSPRKHKSGERSGDGGGGGGRDRERDRDRDRDRERDRDRGREGDQERERGGSGGREIDPGRDHNVARVGSPEVVTPIPKPSSRARAGTVAITQTRDRPLIPYVSTQQPTAQHYPTGTPNNNSLVVSGSLSNNRANSKGSIQPTSAASPQKSHRSTSPPLGVSSSTSGWWEGTDMRYTNESTTDTESGSSQGSADDASGNVSGGIRKISHEKLSEPKHKHSKHPKNDREDPVSLLPKSRHTDQVNRHLHKGALSSIPQDEPDSATSSRSWSVSSSADDWSDEYSDAEQFVQEEAGSWNGSRSRSRSRSPIGSPSNSESRSNSPGAENRRENRTRNAVVQSPSRSRSTSRDKRKHRSKSKKAHKSSKHKLSGSHSPNRNHNHGRSRSRSRSFSSSSSYSSQSHSRSRSHSRGRGKKHRSRNAQFEKRSDLGTLHHNLGEEYPVEGRHHKRSIDENAERRRHKHHHKKKERGRMKNAKEPEMSSAVASTTGPAHPTTTVTQTLTVNTTEKSDGKWSNPLRSAVSKKKRRYVANGFDLDLSYITNRIIAMGYPATGFEAAVRNPYSEVLRFLNQMHGIHYKVYNLCSERSYPPSMFYNRVGIFPFSDHGAPPFELMEMFCKDCDAWLKEDPANIAAVHCKAGKGRTGVMICCYLMYSGQVSSIDEALKHYATARTHDGKGVTIPSQVRYVHYFGSLLFHPDRPKYIKITRSLTGVTLNPVSSPFRAGVYLAVRNGGKLIHKRFYKFSSVTAASPAPDVQFELQLPKEVDMCGDVNVEIFSAHADKLVSFWFNTLFVADSTVFVKGDLDKGCKSKDLAPNFTITIQSTPGSH